MIKWQIKYVVPHNPKGDTYVKGTKNYLWQISYLIHPASLEPIKVVTPHIPWWTVWKRRKNQACSLCGKCPPYEEGPLNFAFGLILCPYCYTVISDRLSTLAQNVRLTVTESQIVNELEIGTTTKYPHKEE